MNEIFLYLQFNILFVSSLILLMLTLKCVSRTLAHEHILRCYNRKIMFCQKHKCFSCWCVMSITK